MAAAAPPRPASLYAEYPRRGRGAAATSLRGRRPRGILPVAAAAPPRPAEDLRAEILHVAAAAPFASAENVHGRTRRTLRRYGEYGSGGAGEIPPGADLEFDCELENIAEGALAVLASKLSIGYNLRTVILGLLVLSFILPVVFPDAGWLH